MRRELVATVGSEEHTVVVSRDDTVWSVVVDDREHEVDARMVRPGTWSLIIGGRSYVVDLDERRHGTFALTTEAEASVLVEDARRKRLARAVAGSGGAVSGEVVKAPIAGKVVKLLVDEGAEVAAGEGVAVLEAMKMENEIKADRGGVVKELHVEAGQSVETNDRLVTLE